MLSLLVAGAIEWTTRIDGPWLVHEGTARLSWTEEEPHDCVDAMVGDYHYFWCHTASDLQLFPVQVPRHFRIYEVRNDFGGEDLTALLTDWGRTDSVWDIDQDGTVDGSDLGHLLSRWRVD